MSSIGNPVFDRTMYALRAAARKSKAAIWRAVIEDLSKARSHRPFVNVGKLNDLTKRGDKVVVPGKVLGSGLLTHSVVVGAFSFSKPAAAKIVKARGRALPLADFAEKYGTAKGVKLIGG